VRIASVALDISPKGEVSLGAAQVRNERWQGVEDPIEANLLAVWSNAGERPVLIVTLDVLYAGRIIRSAIERAASPLTADCVFVAASHTHRAPMTDDTKPGLGKVDDRYVSRLVDQLSTAIRELVQQPGREVRMMRVGESTASHSVNRRRRKFVYLGRRPRFNVVSNAPNPEGVRDETLTTATFVDHDGAPIAVLWNYACHPVGYPIRNIVSAHFPGVVREQIRDRYNSPNLPVLYFQGFSGNTRPSATSKPRTLVNKLRRLLSGPLFDDMTVERYLAWATALGTLVLANLEEATQRPVGAIRPVRTTLAADAFGSPLSGPVTFHGMHFGNALSIVAASAEVVAEYAAPVREMSKSSAVFCVGCIDDTFGYAPTKLMLEQGGYESHDYLAPFGLSALNPDIERSMLEGFRRII
jgi:hypothetical protein